MKIQQIVEKFCQYESHVDDFAYITSVNSFAIYDDEFNYWKILEYSELNEYVYHWLKEHAPTRELRTSYVLDFVKLLKWNVYRKMDEVNTPYLAFKNGIVNTKTYEIEKPSRDIPVYMYQPFTTDTLNMPTPMFDSYLRDVMRNTEGDTSEELITYMIEVIGYLLIPELKGQAMFYLVGGGQNGKSVMLDLIRFMVGERFVSAFSIEHLTTKDFALPGIIGKRVNICSEDESRYINTDKFKALVTGDPIEARRLYGDPFTIIPTTKYIFATNSMPHFKNVDFGVQRRVHVIPFNYRIPDTAIDRNMLEKLIAELPGIIGKAIFTGAKNLAARKYRFNIPQIVQEEMLRFKYESSPVMSFIEVMYERGGENDFIASEDIYYSYRSWCQLTGRKPVKSRTFFSYFREHLGIKKSKTAHSAEHGRTVRGYQAKRRDEHSVDQYDI